ncbi:hypothetical protein ACFQVC_33995 [Streptomyces monticola]|uniref:Fibronectin type III domain-containing protein n=1 Tax=Streptomyces monticola TaxID=2666263 RepID=A0ABW2JT96_9ACTN
MHSTGPELSWPEAKPEAKPESKSAAKSGGKAGNKVVAYQVHRSSRADFKPTTATLVATLGKDTTRFKDTTAEPTPARNAAEIGRHYSYRVLAQTKGGRLLGSPALRVGVPKSGHTLRVVKADSADAARVSGVSGTALTFRGNR